jgi:hypothetical protein
MQARCLALKWRLWNLSLEIQLRAELRDNKQNACDAINSPSIISNEQVMMEQDEQRELAHQNQASSPAFSFADGFAAQPAASPALNPPVVCNGNGQHMGELADDLQVTASPAAAWLRNGWAASPAAIPATADNTSARALDDTGSVLSFAQQSARAPNDNSSVSSFGQQSARAPNENGSVFNFAQQGSPAWSGVLSSTPAAFVINNRAAITSVIPASAHSTSAPHDSSSGFSFAQQGNPARWNALVSSIQGPSMAPPLLRAPARTRRLAPVHPPSPPPANQGTGSQSSQAAASPDVFAYAAEPNNLTQQKQLERWRRAVKSSAIIKAQMVDVAKSLFADFEEAATTTTTTTTPPPPPPHHHPHHQQPHPHLWPPSLVVATSWSLAGWSLPAQCPHPSTSVLPIMPHSLSLAVPTPSLT